MVDNQQQENDSNSEANSSPKRSLIPNLDSIPPELVQNILSLSEERAKSRLSLTCKALSSVSNASLYRTIILDSSSKVRLLARSLNQQPKLSVKPAGQEDVTNPHRSTPLPDLYHLLLASQDGLMSPNETITSQKEWGPSLKSIFTCGNSETLRTLALISRPSGAALETFLSKHTKARPTNVSIYRLSVSTPAFSILDLTPLSRVTHLNLVQILPTEPLLTFFKTKQSGHHHPLSHLRLSEVDPQSLLDFGEFINWRRSFDLWERKAKASRLSGRSDSPSVPPPDPPLVPSRRFSSQEALFSLASTLPHLPNFKVLIIEIVKLPSLEKPPSGLDLTTGEESGENGSLLTMDWSSNLPSSLQEESDWLEREERNRTWERDSFWLKLREGLVDLKELIEQNQKEFREASEVREEEREVEDDQAPKEIGNGRERSDSEIEVRLVIPKPRGWDVEEIIQDFKSQTVEREAFEFQFNKGGEHQNVEIGCWRDQDLFLMSQKRPWLSWARKDEDESDYSRGGRSSAFGEQNNGDGGSSQKEEFGEERDELGPLKDWRTRGDKSWWTGELPRLDAGRERTPFDFQP